MDLVDRLACMFLEEIRGNDHGSPHLTLEGFHKKIAADTIEAYARARTALRTREALLAKETLVAAEEPKLPTPEGV